MGDDGKRRARHPDEAPDHRSGYVVLGRMVVAGVVREKLERLAAARGLTPLALAREGLSAWVMAQPDP